MKKITFSFPFILNLHKTWLINQELELLCNGFFFCRLLFFFFSFFAVAPFSTKMKSVKIRIAKFENRMIIGKYLNAKSYIRLYFSIHLFFVLKNLCFFFLFLNVFTPNIVLFEYAPLHDQPFKLQKLQTGKSKRPKPQKKEACKKKSIFIVI